MQHRTLYLLFTVYGTAQYVDMHKYYYKTVSFIMNTSYK